MVSQKLASNEPHEYVRRLETRSRSSHGTLVFTHHNDEQDRPAGGSAVGPGFVITWQDGPVDQAAGEKPNGAFIEDVLQAVVDRMEYFQEGEFACDENNAALSSMRHAQHCMMERRRSRDAQGVLGKHEHHVGSMPSMFASGRVTTR